MRGFDLWTWQEKYTKMAVYFLPIGTQTAGPNGLKFSMGRGWTVGQFVGGCDQSHPLCGCGKKHKNVIFMLL